MNFEDLVSHPQVLWAAWLRVNAWYRKGNIAPQPELAIWRLHPEAELRKLGRQLRNGEWAPGGWNQVPYPKKGMLLRHYWMPTVKDEVAFMAHMVLLGPLLDYQIPNFAFGNRWYRPIAWNRRMDPAYWVSRPYPFFTEQIYRPYSRAHGLFRRVASWTVSRMLNVEIQRVDFSGPVQTPEDYPDDTLPMWTMQSWWRVPEPELEPRARWAALDLQLAFPSVLLDRLAEALERMLSRDSDSVDRILGGYPGVVVDALGQADIRQQIASNLVTGLRGITTDETIIPQNAWRPHHATQELPPQNLGLPTGLSISGFLLNVVLYPADREILNYLELQQGDPHQRGAFLRFADDMIVFSKTTSGLFALIDKSWCAISNNANATLAVQQSNSNLRVSIAKIAPKRVQEVLHGYLRQHDWKKRDECEEMIPPDDSSNSKSLEQWWTDQSRSANGDSYSRWRDKLDRDSVGPHELSPFVTNLIEQMSEIGRDTLLERFGEDARNRLVRLHDLARLDIDDQQVRPDTRRAFAANRLVSAWLPVETEDKKEERRDIGEIRDSIAFVLQETPWKFGLWRAVVRAAARRPTQADDGKDDDRAQNWLLRLLKRIACRACDASNEAKYEPDYWAVSWPSADAMEHHERDPAWRSLYLSFHRAAFWHALANEIVCLRRYQDQVSTPRNGRAGPSPRNWAVRAIPEDKFGQVADFLANLDSWVEILYGEGGNKCDPSGCTWEVDQLVVAVLSTLDRATLTEAWSCCEQPGNFLMIPQAAIPAGIPMTEALLQHFGRLQPSDGTLRDLNTSALSQVYLGVPSDRLDDLLFPAGMPPTIVAGHDIVHTAMVGIELGCSASIPTNILSRIVVKPVALVRQIQDDPLKLKEYERARNVLMTRPDGLIAWKAGCPTIHRILWGVEPGTSRLTQWMPRPWEIPEVGLTVSVALRLFETVQEGHDDGGLDLRIGPFTWALCDGHEMLASARRLQFAEEGARTATRLSPPRATRTDSWEVPPHSAYFLPLIAGFRVNQIDFDDFAMYCDILHLLTALDGGEAILHALAKCGAGSIPFQDRWGWRSRIHLRREVWQLIEKAVRWSQTPLKSLSNLRAEIRDSVRHDMGAYLGIDRDYQERVDILLEPLGDEIEVVRTVTQLGSANNQLPEKLRLNRNSLASSLVVRICQVSQWPDQEDVLLQFPRMDPQTEKQVMQQVASAFRARRGVAGEREPEIVLLPEVSFPVSEAQTLRRLVEARGCAALAGFYWRELTPAYPLGPRSRGRRCWFVNEAELVIPVGFDSPGPTSSRWFRVRKPVPAHIETGLARALTSATPGTQWSVLRGRRFYRFLHPRWGDFSIAVCADLLDSAPWRFLRGELLHLFMVAYNRDVRLYEALTWVRAYENYVNLIAVNHGKYGGSILWTPRRRNRNELAQLRGNELFLLADVTIPVRDLADVQKNGVENAIRAAECEWKQCQARDNQFKAPPPGFERTC